MFNDCLEKRYDDSVRVTHTQVDPLTEEVRLETPVGTLTSILQGNVSNVGVMPKKWLVETEEDLKVLCYIEEGMTYSFDRELYDRLYEQRAHLGLPTIFLPRTTIQRLYLDMMGIEETIFALADYPDTVEAYFRVLTENQEKMLKVVSDSPIEWVNYGDNLHCGTLPPPLFEKYVLPVYQRRNEVLRGAGIFTFAHWDGDCASLLPYARETGLSGIEAITPVPQGDVTLRQVKQYLGDDIFLIDGLAALLFTETFPIEMLRAQFDKVTDLFGGQLVLGISDELPSDGLLSRMQLVGEWVREYNARQEGGFC